MYVDDILALLERSSAPLLTGLIVVLLLALRVPMSWHKFSQSVRGVDRLGFQS